MYLSKEKCIFPNRKMKSSALFGCQTVVPGKKILDHLTSVRLLQADETARNITENIRNTIRQRLTQTKLGTIEEKVGTCVQADETARNIPAKNIRHEVTRIYKDCEIVRNISIYPNEDTLTTRMYATDAFQKDIAHKPTILTEQTDVPYILVFQFIVY